MKRTAVSMLCLNITRYRNFKNIFLIALKPKFSSWLSVFVFITSQCFFSGQAASHFLRMHWLLFSSPHWSMIALSFSLSSGS